MSNNVKCSCKSLVETAVVVKTQVALGSLILVAFTTYTQALISITPRNNFISTVECLLPLYLVLIKMLLFLYCSLKMKQTQISAFYKLNDLNTMLNFMVHHE